jgi:hypothetical protein
MHYTILVLLLALAISACSSQPSPKAQEPSRPKPASFDTTTPEGLILKLEDAYRRKDMATVIKCRNFKAEAYYMLKYDMGNKLGLTTMEHELVDQTAEVLELGFRKEIEQRGFPDFTGLRSAFPSKKKLQDGFWEITEVCTFPDGGHSKQRLLLYFDGTSYTFCHPIRD